MSHYTEITVERLNQDKKWGKQGLEPKQWIPILLEEVGEVARALNDNDLDNYRMELIQVAAVIKHMLECFDDGIY